MCCRRKIPRLCLTPPLGDTHLQKESAMNKMLTFAATATLAMTCSLIGTHDNTARAAEPLASGIDLKNFDKSVRPQDDLFRAVNGAWLAKAQIPADRSSYGASRRSPNRRRRTCARSSKSCADAKDNPPGSERQKIGDMYASYMNEERAEQLGIEPIVGMLAAIDRIETKSDLVRSLAELDRVGVSGVLACYVNTDAKKSDQYILHLSQAGLGLPDRDYYWDTKFKTKLAAYAKHVEHMLTLAKVADPKQAAADIVAFETRLAKAQWSKLENRDSIKTYNKKTRDELAKLAPGFDWNLYFATLGIKDAQEFIVSQPSYITAMAAMVDSVPLATWKAWLKWHVIRRVCEPAEQGIGRRGLRLLRHNAPRRPSEPAALETSRRCRRGGARRGSWKVVCGKALPARSQGTNGPDGGQSDRGLPPSLPEQRLDEPRDQTEGAGQAGDLQPENRLSEKVARLFAAGNPPR